jgi:hypothetical protein
MILEGWCDAIWSGRYLGVRYDCASPSVARWINRLAKKVGLTVFGLHGSRANDRRADRRPPPAAPDDEATATDETNASEEPVRTPGDQAQTAPVRAPAPEQATPPEPPPAPEPETAEAAAERERRCRELFGMDEPKPRRRWRR